MVYQYEMKENIFVLQTRLFQCLSLNYICIIVWEVSACVTTIHCKRLFSLSMAGRGHSGQDNKLRQGSM